MRSIWSNVDASMMIERYAAGGAPSKVSQRRATSRVLGGELRGVLHAGGDVAALTR